MQMKLIKRLLLKFIAGALVLVGLLAVAQVYITHVYSSWNEVLPGLTQELSVDPRRILIVAFTGGVLALIFVRKKDD